MAKLVETRGGRLKLYCTPAERPKAQRAIGASAVQGGCFTYPRDPLVIFMLQTLLKENLEIEKSIKDWFETTLATEKKLLDLAERVDGSVTVETDRRLRPYQRVAVDFLLEAKRAIEGDDRGLGKTLVALTAATKIPNAKRVLVVAPNYLKLNWLREIHKWFPQETVIAVTGERPERERLIATYFNSATKFLIVNYEMLRTKVERGGYPILLKQAWDLVICDEGHRLRGRRSQFTEGAKMLRSKYLFLLTGNPMANRPEDIWQLLNLLDPGRFTSYWNFVEYFCEVVESFYGKEIGGLRQEKLAELQFTLQPYLLRRLKKQVAPELPEKLHIPIYVDLTGKQKTFYRNLEKLSIIALEEGGIEVVDTEVTLMVRLQQALANPKLIGGPDESVIEDTALELISDIFVGEKKVIVGCWFTAAIESFRARLAAQKIETYVITGEVRSEDRDRIVQAFKKSDKPCVLLGGIRAMSEGLDIDECNSMIFMDKSWIPMDNEQFEDRIHRIISTETKRYYHIVVNRTISSHREDILADKQNAINESLAMHAVAKALLKTKQLKDANPMITQEELDKVSARDFLKSHS
jgi:SNF2 family DNA or RNA helicase